MKTLAEEIAATSRQTEKWFKDIEGFYIPQLITLADLFFDVLREVRDPAVQEKFLLRFRAIDKRARGMYHHSTVAQSNNEQSQPSPVSIFSNSPDAGAAAPEGEGPMEEE